MMQDGNSALILSAKCGHMNVVQLLLEGRADVDTKDQVPERINPLPLIHDRPSSALISLERT